MWILQYRYFFSSDPELGDLYSLVIGYGLCLALYVIDAPLCMISNKLWERGFCYKLIFEDFVIFCTFFVHCILWRGAWNCTSRYILPDLETGGWVCFVFGSIGLLTTQCMSYAGAMGCAVDGEAPDTAMFFQSKYLLHFCSQDAVTSSILTATVVIMPVLCNHSMQFFT